MTPELNVSQQAKSEAEDLDGWHKLPEKEVALDQEVSTSYSYEINDLSRALESRLSLSEQPLTTADRARASTIRRTYDSSVVRDNARTQFAHASEDDSSHDRFIGPTTSGHARAHFNNAYEDGRGLYSWENIKTSGYAIAHYGHAHRGDRRHYSWDNVTARDNAVVHHGDAYGDNSRRYSFTTSGNAGAHFNQDLEDENLVQCFVDGCSARKPYMSVLL
jgi:hypothetical protein